LVDVSSLSKCPIVGFAARPLPIFAEDPNFHTSSLGSSRAVGNAGELAVKQYLAKQGIQTERGYFMNPNTVALTKTPQDSENFVQLDLYAQEANVVYESKVGYRTLCLASTNEIARQSALIENGFLTAYYWISVPNFAGGIGLSGTLNAAIDVRGMCWTYFPEPQ
jgi:hypothetical protein